MSALQANRHSPTHKETHLKIADHMTTEKHEHALIEKALERLTRWGKNPNSDGYNVLFYSEKSSDNSGYIIAVQHVAATG
jgi:hypothetical protein